MKSSRPTKILLSIIYSFYVIITLYGSYKILTSDYKRFLIAILILGTLPFLTCVGETLKKNKMTFLDAIKINLIPVISLLAIPVLIALILISGNILSILIIIPLYFIPTMWIPYFLIRHR